MYVTPLYTGEKHLTGAIEIINQRGIASSNME